MRGLTMHCAGVSSAGLNHRLAGQNADHLPSMPGLAEALKQQQQQQQFFAGLPGPPCPWSDASDIAIEPSFSPGVQVAAAVPGASGMRGR